MKIRRPLKQCHECRETFRLPVRGVSFAASAGLDDHRAIRFLGEGASWT